MPGIVATGRRADKRPGVLLTPDGVVATTRVGIAVQPPEAIVDADLAHTIWLVVIGALVVSIIATTVRGLLLGRGGGGVADVVDTRNVLCASCGWQGEIPRLAKRCPNCGENNFTN